MKKMLLLIILLSGTYCLFAQNVGIGTATPSETLEVNGSVKITDGTQGDGKVLTSNADGKASWRPTAFGENVRFFFKYTTDPDYTSTVYNYGNTDVDWADSSMAPKIVLYINTPGLYRFDINATILSTLFDDGGVPRIEIYDTAVAAAALPESNELSSTLLTSIITPGNTYNGTADKSFYYYIPIEKSITIILSNSYWYLYEPYSGFATISVSGVKVAD